MGKMRDLSGLRFGKLTAVKAVGKRHGKFVWLWKCDCGKSYTSIGSSVTSAVYGSTVSCGCSRASRGGMATSREYHIWYNMLKRCHDKNNKDYKNYGGRGITVSDSWNEFENFYSDMGDAPDKFTLDRIDNGKGYSKANCRWASWIRQANNRRSNRVIEHNGVEKTLSQWARSLGIRTDTLYRRLLRMDKARALNSKL